ncbi:MAG: PQQ-dependent sugar dehydrogenase [Pseudomonadota bacterium]
MRRLSLVTMMALCACSDGDPDPPPGNMAPSFTSPTTASVAEDASGVVYTASANDANGDPVTFSIAGGADAALFSLAADGALSLTDAADFERPQDDDRDNVYEITLRASDGFEATTLNLAVTVIDGPEPYRLARVATGFSSPLFLTGRPGETDVFVTERSGVIRLLDPETGVIDPNPFLDISADVGLSGEGGLLGFAPAPDYVTSGEFYVHITNTVGDTEIRRYERFTFAPDSADPASADIILTVSQPAGNHNGGWIGFGADGFLYIALGDGGGSGDPFGNSQDINTLLGAVLRIDPSSDDFPTNALRDYAIPPDNPFASAPGAPEIWAFGLRNPFRGSFDRDTGDLYLGDVGQGDIEEVDLAEDGDGGLNFGWPLREGTEFEQGLDDADFTPPVLEYDHGSGPREGNSITGGYVYRGAIATIEGRYFFADFISANIWSVPVDEIFQDDTIGSEDFILETDVLAPDVGSLDNPVSFGEDNDGELYIIDIGGDIFRIEPAP